jgi:hypothetical protein
MCSPCPFPQLDGISACFDNFFTIRNSYLEKVVFVILASAFWQCLQSSHQALCCHLHVLGFHLKTSLASSHPHPSACRHWQTPAYGSSSTQSGGASSSSSWRAGPCKGQNPHQGRHGHPQLLHDSPLGHLGPPELDGSPPGPDIKVFVDLRHCEKALAQNTKTIFFKKHFLMANHRLNTVKLCLHVEKDRGNTCRKKSGKKNQPVFFFWRIF